MKNLHAIIILCLAVLLPTIGSAQCSCSGGTTPDSVVHNFTLGLNSSPTISIGFPKFDPALGTLSCLVYKDTLSAVSTTRVKNLDSADQEYAFRLTVNNMITAPGISSNSYVDKFYGPDSLKAYNKGLDSVVYGPDTTFNKVKHTITKTTGLSAFMGTGNVYFSHTINGGLISMSGGLNFSQRIETSRWGSFKLTYYWCPNSVLATHIQNFIVNKKDQGVTLAWTTSNQSHNYEIEISRDGKNFSSVGKANQASSSGSTSTKYQYQYNADQTLTGTVYFRIKETDTQGKVSYSETRTVAFPQSNFSNTIFPNPAVNTINIQLGESVQGEVAVALVNATGQTVYQKLYPAANLNNINVTWPVSVKQGIYYLKVQNMQTQRQTVSKIFIK